MFVFRKWTVYRVASEVSRRLGVESVRWPRPHWALGDQVRRSSSSVVLNIAEGAGQPRGSNAKKRHYEIAMGSAYETAANVEEAAGLGLVPEALAAELMGQLEEVAAMLGGLLRSVRRQRMAHSRSAKPRASATTDSSR